MLIIFLILLSCLCCVELFFTDGGKLSITLSVDITSGPVRVLHHLRQPSSVIGEGACGVIGEGACGVIGEGACGVIGEGAVV